MKPGETGRAAAILLALCAACAPLPRNLPPPPTLAAPHAEASLHAQDGASPWPARPWWHAFADAALDGLEARALAGNPSLLSAAQRLEEASRLARLAEIDAGVHYGGDLSAQRGRLSANGIYPPPLGGMAYTQYDASFSASYSIDWWGRNRALVAAAADDRAAAMAEAAAARLAISSLVADAYFALAEAEARRELIGESIEMRRQAVELLKIRLRHGLDHGDRVRQAEQVLARDRGELSRSEYERSRWRFRLAALLGEGPDASASLPPAKLAAPLALPPSLPLDWLAQRPDVAALKRRIEAERLRTEAVKAEFYPNVNLALLAGFQSLAAATWLRHASLNGTAGPAVHLPLFDTSTLQARLGLQQATYGEAIAAYNRTVVDAAREAADGYALVANLAQRSAAQADATAAARRTADLARLRHRRGLAGRLDLLTAELALLAERDADLQLQAARVRATVGLAQALGGGGPSDD
ncbi:MAG TPA: efflux transporter outer membrane subunit [Rhodocyclaceae bacterium]